MLKKKSCKNEKWFNVEYCSIINSKIEIHVDFVTSRLNGRDVYCYNAESSLERDLIAIKGVEALHVPAGKYNLSVFRGKLFSWEEVIPEVKRVIKKHRNRENCKKIDECCDCCCCKCQDNYKHCCAEKAIYLSIAPRHQEYAASNYGISKWDRVQLISISKGTCDVCKIRLKNGRIKELGSSWFAEMQTHSQFWEIYNKLPSYRQC
jgi:hypothetical protein